MIRIQLLLSMKQMLMPLLRVQKILNRLRGPVEQSEIWLSRVGQRANLYLGDQNPQILQDFGPRQAAELVQIPLFEVREEDDARRGEAVEDDFPDEAAARVCEAVAGEDGLDDEGQHFVGDLDHFVVGLGEGGEQDEAQEEADVDVVEAGGNQEIAFEGGAAVVV